MLCSARILGLALMVGQGKCPATKIEGCEHAWDGLAHRSLYSERPSWFDCMIRKNQRGLQPEDNRPQCQLGAADAQGKPDDPASKFVDNGVPINSLA
jgi:hypothetical protein